METDEGRDTSSKKDEEGVKKSQPASSSMANGPLENKELWDSVSIHINNLFKTIWDPWHAMNNNLLSFFYWECTEKQRTSRLCICNMISWGLSVIKPIWKFHMLSKRKCYSDFTEMMTTTAHIQIPPTSYISLMMQYCWDYWKLGVPLRVHWCYCMRSTPATVVAAYHQQYSNLQ